PPEPARGGLRPVRTGRDPPGVSPHRRPRPGRGPGPRGLPAVRGSPAFPPGPRGLRGVPAPHDREPVEEPLPAAGRRAFVPRSRGRSGPRRPERSRRPDLRIDAHTPALPAGPPAGGDRLPLLRGPAR